MLRKDDILWNYLFFIRHENYPLLNLSSQLFMRILITSQKTKDEIFLILNETIMM